jgi:hypothetical protein
VFPIVSDKTTGSQQLAALVVRKGRFNNILKLLVEAKDIGFLFPATFDKLGYVRLQIASRSELS